ncbi:MAG: TolC family protein [Cyclonatronaceae bacterium]
MTLYITLILLVLNPGFMLPSGQVTDSARIQQSEPDRPPAKTVPASQTAAPESQQLSISWHAVGQQPEKGVITLLRAYQQSLSPGTLTLEEAQQLAAEHHPLRSQQPLQESIRDLNIRNLNTQYLPDFTVSASAQYQSEVTEIAIPVPGAIPPTQPKDRYSLSLNVNQLIWDGGRVSSARDVERSYRELESQSVEVEIYKRRDQVNEAYFNVLITRKRLESTDLLATDVDARLGQVRVRVESGAVLPSQADVLEAEKIRIRQQRSALAAAHRTALEVLSELTGTDLPEDVALSVPDPQINGTRPEYKLFSLNRETLENREKMTSRQYRPVISGFAQTAYSRPGLDIFDESFSPWYMVGVTARWNLWNWNKSSRERQVLHLERKLVDSREAAFEQQISVAERAYLNSISRLTEVMAMDDEIITLRKRIAEQSEHQLLNGSITATEYLAELNALHQARLTKTIHDLELRQTHVSLATHRGTQP